MNTSSLDAQPMVPPGLPPPPGTMPNFINPHSISGAIGAVNILFLVLTSVTTLIRTYTKIFLVKSFGWSDYTMILGWLGFISTSALMWVNARNGAGAHQWDVPITDLISFAKMSYIVQSIYPPVQALIKLSICLQLVNIFTPDHDRKFWQIQGFILVNALYYFICWFFVIFQCNPRNKAWNPTLPGKCIQLWHYVLATGVINTVSDFLMLVFPIFWVWNLQMSKHRKFGVSAIFLVGMLALIASILRVVFSIINRTNQDETFTLVQEAECVVGEITGGILVGNLMCLPRFFRTYLPKFKGLITLHSHSSRSGKQTKDIETALAPHRRTVQNESGQYLELKEQSFKPVFVAAYNDTKLNPSLGRVAVDSPQESQTFFNENYSSHHNDTQQLNSEQGSVRHV